MAPGRSWSLSGPKVSPPEVVQAAQSHLTKTSEPTRGDRASGGLASTLILCGSLVLLLSLWTVGVGTFVEGSGSKPLGVALELAGTIVLGLIGAAFGVRWGHDRRAAVDGEATTRELLRTSLADLANALELTRTIVDSSPVATMAYDKEQNITFWSAAAERTFGWKAEEVIGGPMPPQTLFSEDLASTADRIERNLAGSIIRGERVRRKSRDGRELVLEIWAGPLIRDGAVAGYAGQMIDITDRESSRVELGRLGAAVDQTIDGVVIADASGTIVYVNEAYERQSGYAAADLIGGHHSTIVGRIVGDEVHQSMLQAAMDGVPWFGEVEQRRADGSTSLVQLSITDIREERGDVKGFVAVQRDVTYMRTIEGDLALEAGVRGVLSGAVHMVPAEATLHSAAQAVCEGLCTIRGIDFASVEVFLAPQDAALVAICAPDGFPLGPGDHLSPAFSSRLFTLAALGPWGEHWASRPEDTNFGIELDRAGLKAFAFAPIVHGDHVDGGVGIGTRDPAFAATLAGRFPVLVDFNTAPTALLAERLHAHRNDVAIRSTMLEVISQRAFHPVYQPIVELATGEVVGYEALTRFESGQRPDLAFADARTAGLGMELELATLDAAVRGSHGLPAGPWLDVNVSPGLLGYADELRRALAQADRPVILEVTEHEPVDDYAALREAVRSLGPEVRLAVDDAGAGIANFAHIIELDADLVKLDISLVRGVNSSPGRQALVVAMSHFARTAGCRLVAEGIETEAEAGTLLKFGVEFGQGYWFGRPEPVAGSASRPGQAPTADGVLER